MKIALGATYQISNGRYAVAWDIRSNIVEWHFFNALSDIINDDYCDKEYWSLKDICNFYNLRGV